MGERWGEKRRRVGEVGGGMGWGGMGCMGCMGCMGSMGSMGSRGSRGGWGGGGMAIGAFLDADRKELCEEPSGFGGGDGCRGGLLLARVGLCARRTLELARDDRLARLRDVRCRLGACALVVAAARGDTRKARLDRGLPLAGEEVVELGGAEASAPISIQLAEGLRGGGVPVGGAVGVWGQGGVGGVRGEVRGGVCVMRGCGGKTTGVCVCVCVCARARVCRLRPPAQIPTCLSPATSGTSKPIESNALLSIGRPMTRSSGAAVL